MPVSDDEVRAEWERLYSEYRTEWRYWHRKLLVTEPQVCCGIPRLYDKGAFSACRECGSEYVSIPAPKPPPTLAELREQMEAAA